MDVISSISVCLHSNATILLVQLSFLLSLMSNLVLCLSLALEGSIIHLYCCPYYHSKCLYLFMTLQMPLLVYDKFVYIGTPNWWQVDSGMLRLFSSSAIHLQRILPALVLDIFADAIAFVPEFRLTRQRNFRWRRCLCLRITCYGLSSTQSSHASSLFCDSVLMTLASNLSVGDAKQLICRLKIR